ncbi:MAG: cyclase family protein [Verrucomicrobiales bacterium]|nr:cyclase family protein [Verrucomicrobiales bacterium]
MISSQRWIDVTVPLRDGMPTWPGDPVCRITRAVSMEEGAVCNLTELHLSAHTATHMDAPRHFIAQGLTMEQMPLEAVIGPCRVLDLQAVEGQITPADLEPHEIGAGERLLLKTRNSAEAWPQDRFVEDFISIRADTGQYLVDRGVMTVGVDYLSIGGFEKDGVETHQIMLGAEIWVIEGLDLSAVEPGNYELLCLPLKIEGADGAPCRVLLRPQLRPLR